MKAFVLEKPSPIERFPLQFAEVEKPIPADDEILIKVSACGVCRTDLHLCEGELKHPRERIIPGHQIVGKVAGKGNSVSKFSNDDRVGIAWLNRTCGKCRFCMRGKENLCDSADFTGYTVNGGFAEYAIAPAEFAYHLPSNFSDLQAAPLLCAGIIGYRALRLTGIVGEDWNGAKLGIFGFGAAGHMCLQIARSRGARIFVATRDREHHQGLALELGAEWVGDTFDSPPVLLDAAIVFAPAGEVVPAALKNLEKGGSVVLGGIHMSAIPEIDYEKIYGERIIRSVANNTRSDGNEFLKEAAEANIETHCMIFPFEKVNNALIALKHDAIRGAAVVKVSPN